MRSKFARPDGTVAIFSEEALTTLLRFRQLGACDNEAGGVLLGRHLKDGGHIVIDEVTVPMKGDWRCLTMFRRGRASHQRVIDERWRESSGTCRYLGEWHTHPEPHPTPSFVDTRDWGRRMRRDVVDAATVLFVIVGTAQIAVWQGDRSTGVLTRLFPVAQ